MIFQNYALFPHKTIFDNVAFGLKYRDVSKEDIKQK
jgi:ABC-type Fe3+/spermidine/putrescine transport system ATPase subunit